LFIGVACLLVTALLAWIHAKHPLCLPPWGAITTAGLVVALFFVIDPIVERGRWRVGGHYSVQK